MGNTRASQLVGAAVGAWLSVEVAAVATALELAISGTSPLNVALPAMAGVHALIGLGEALITVSALAFIQQTRPDIIGIGESIGEPSKVAASGSGWIAVGILIALAVTLFSPLASPNPDGLERVAEDQGFLSAAQEPPFTILPDYKVPFIENEALTTIAAGVAGTLLVAGIGFGMSRVNDSKRVTSAEQVKDSGVKMS